MELEELENIFKKYFKIKGIVTIYHEGGVCNPLKLRLVYFEGIYPDSDSLEICHILPDSGPFHVGRKKDEKN